MRAPVLLALATGSLFLLTGCNHQAPEVPPPVATAPKPKPPAPAPAAMASAKATISGLGGSAVAGDVTFTDTGNGTSIEAHLTGLAPGKHGFHIHETGDCSGDGTAAGDHFNPGSMPHGGPDGTSLHAGDMGNLVADAQGNAQLTMLSKHVTLDNGPMGIVGRAVIVHENEDDLTSQPAGNAGSRVACGVIALTTPMPAAGETMGAGMPAGESMAMPGGMMGAEGATGASAP